MLVGDAWDPALAAAVIVCDGGGVPSDWLSALCEKAVAAPASSSAVAISRRASSWLPPPSATCPGTRPRRTARHSVSRQTTKCAHTSQRMQASTLMISVAEMLVVSQSVDGAVRGSG